MVTNKNDKGQNRFSDYLVGQTIYSILVIIVFNLTVLVAGGMPFQLTKNSILDNLTILLVSFALFGVYFVWDTFISESNRDKIIALSVSLTVASIFSMFVVRIAESMFDFTEIMYMLYIIFIITIIPVTIKIYKNIRSGKSY
mgnify:CR=1 FL=1|jgi:hypothetical protein